MKKRRKRKAKASGDAREFLERETARVHELLARGGRRAVIDDVWRILEEGGFSPEEARRLVVDLDPPN